MVTVILLICLKNEQLERSLYLVTCNVRMQLVYVIMYPFSMRCLYSLASSMLDLLHCWKGHLKASSAVLSFRSSK